MKMAAAEMLAAALCEQTSSHIKDALLRLDGFRSIGWLLNDLRELSPVAHLEGPFTSFGLSVVGYEATTYPIGPHTAQLERPRRRFMFFAKVCQLPRHPRCGIRISSLFVLSLSISFCCAGHALVLSALFVRLPRLPRSFSLLSFSRRWPQRFGLRAIS